MGKSENGFLNPKTDFAFFGEIQKQITNPKVSTLEEDTSD